MRLSAALLALATASSDWAASDEGLSLLQFRATVATEMGAQIAVEQPQENKGYEVKQRFSVDGVVNCEFIDFGVGAFAADGAIYVIRYYVKRAGNQNLRYRIYRPTTTIWSTNPYYKSKGTDIEFTFVAQTEELDCSAVGEKEVTFAVPVEYKAGDYIGWGHDGNGNIAFDSTDQGVPRTPDSWVAWARVPKNDNVGTPTQFVNGPGWRQHSYQLICEPPTTTTTTTQAIEEPIEPDDEEGDSAEAVGDPHIRTNKNKHFDLE